MLYSAENPVLAEILQGYAPFAAADLGDRCPHAVSGRDRERNNRLHCRQYFPPGIVADDSIYRFMCGAGLNQIAVFEAVDSNPGRGIAGFGSGLDIGDNPLAGDPPEGSFLPVMAYPLQLLEVQPKPVL